MNQELVNMLIGIAGFLGATILTVIWNNLRDLKRADEKLAASVSELKVMVSGGYATRMELDNAVTALFAKLDRIEDKLDKKADR